MIEEEKRKLDELTKQNDKIRLQYEELQKQKLLKEEAAAKETTNLVPFILVRKQLLSTLSQK